MATEITVAQPSRSSGMELLAEMSRKTNDPQAAIEIAKQIVELETKWESLRQNRDRFEWEKLERQAKVAFAEAFKKFKDDAPKILKTKHVTFGSGEKATSYWHAELDKACDILIPALLKVGITHRWVSEDLPGACTRVTCYLRNDLGYEEKGASLAGPSDQSGGKNPIQGVVSCSSYLERKTFLASLGLAASNTDNDGAAVIGMTNEASAPLIAEMESQETPERVMVAYAFAIEKAKSFTPPDYRAMTIFTTARDEKLKSLKRSK